MKRIACVLALLMMVGACRSTATEGPAPSGPTGSVAPSASASATATAAASVTVTAPVESVDNRAETAGVCAPSSVAKGIACPKRTVPPGTGSSPEGCKSDADCKDGKDGRCIGGHFSFMTEPGPRERIDNLLAGPRRPPPRSQCVYDECQSDRDCAKANRCECRSGVGAARNACRTLDACLTDHDCKADTLCSCGASGNANACMAGNCRTNADCKGLSCDADSNGGLYCRTPRDACSKPADCKPPAEGYGMPICVFKSDSHARACDVRYPPPPG